MDNAKELTKVAIIDHFNKCVAAGVTQSEINECIEYLATLILNDAKPALIEFATTKIEGLEAEKAALTPKKLEAEAAYDAAIATTEAGKAELEAV